MKKLILLICCAVMCIVAQAQETLPAAIRQQADKVKDYLSGYLTEKAYLHFDKPYYAAGDTIYFKAYVVTSERNQLSPLSGVLYADLIGPDDRIRQTLQLQLVRGMAKGDFELPDTLKGGNYRIRAYTRLMRSQAPDGFFDRLIPIAGLSETKHKTTEKSNTLPKPLPQVDIQFLPESGLLVNGIESTVAFKAISSNGNGVDVTGELKDSQGNVMVKFASTHLGMGNFRFTPKAGQVYYAEVAADGRKQTITLPAAQNAGVVMAVQTLADRFSVDTKANNEYYELYKGLPISILMYGGGKVTTLSYKLDEPGFKLDIPKNRLAAGIVQITALSPKGEPLCERLVFNDHNSNLTISAITAKDAYVARELVKLKIHVQDGAYQPAQGSFSLSVTDNSKVMVNPDRQETILTNLLLTSDLKGYIEDPGYYFNNPTDKTHKHLDLVMLTHGYRQFNWNDLNKPQLPASRLEPETGLRIAGVARSLGGKPLTAGTVNLVPIRGKLLSQSTGANGEFSFNNLVFYDTVDFALSAINAKGGNGTKLTLTPDRPAEIVPSHINGRPDTGASSVIGAYLQNSRERHNEQLEVDAGTRHLAEVKIRSTRKPLYRTLSLAGAGNADQVIHMADLKTGGPLSSVLNGRLRFGITFTSGSAMANGFGGKRQPLLVVLDGTVLSSSADNSIDFINTNDVETIEVLSPNNVTKSIYGTESRNGVLIITTKQGGGRPEDVQSRGVLPLKLAGFYRAKEFYSPVYDHTTVTRPDLRSTIYWAPDVVTDKDGNASIEFYNADASGSYQVTIEGIDEKGNLGASRFVYEVKNK